MAMDDRKGPIPTAAITDESDIDNIIVEERDAYINSLPSFLLSSNSDGSSAPTGTYDGLADFIATFNVSAVIDNPRVSMLISLM